mgnify:FL=1|uniref:Uncharacterized protein n=1 Tax=viral metagenome TaxID=1070528 RepID=A0A6C0AW20_9ZZZZ|tara:strand:- start:11079 stop:11696 length:618 start_codon:yes stop_codon:yes gene_type:complete
MAVPVENREDSNINELILTQINSYEYNESDDDEEEFINEVYEEDEDHIERFKENDTYYIGLCYKDKRNNDAILLDMSISSGLFLKYSYDIIYKVLGGPRIKYTSDNNEIKHYNNMLYYHKNRDIQLQIYKTDFKNLDQHPFEWSLGVIIKTFWLRLVQRKWKKIFKERYEIIHKRMNPINLHYRSVHGNWPHGLNYLPSLKDMNM